MCLSCLNEVIRNINVKVSHVWMIKRHRLNRWMKPTVLHLSEMSYRQKCHFAHPEWAAWITFCFLASVHCILFYGNKNLNQLAKNTVFLNSVLLKATFQKLSLFLSGFCWVYLKFRLQSKFSLHCQIVPSHCWLN